MLKLVSVKETVFGIEVLAKVEPYLEDMQNIENSRMSQQMICSEKKKRTVPSKEERRNTENTEAQHLTVNPIQIDINQL